MRTIDGLQRVDVIHRRIDDLFLDPETVDPDSTLGVPGLMRAWRKGTVGLANAPGAGVADDKVVYAFVPEIIRYYLAQEPILPNVAACVCLYDDQRHYVVEHLHELVVKPSNESGSYGMLIGPTASASERDEFRARIQADPRNYIAQPLIKLSTVPTVVSDHVEPRHVDLRPFVLLGERMYVTPGGLTRVALRRVPLPVLRPRHLRGRRDRAAHGTRAVARARRGGDGAAPGAGRRLGRGAPVACRGFDPERFVLTCNGRRVPLQATGERGEAVAGVRYKAWPIALGMHPTVPVHAPLVFDLVDRRLGCPVGGCVYHVTHPGGLAYEAFPVNAFEAEARRVSRFWSWGHSARETPPPWAQRLRMPLAAGAGGHQDPAPEHAASDHPCTLDLRRLPPS